MTESLETELKQFIIDTLVLEDINPEEIESEQQLFGEGLGLDSVDALELGMAIHKKYGVELDPKDDSTKEHFSSIRSLATLIASTRTQ